MLNKTDQIRARFQENDPVSFGQRPPRHGTIIRINRTTATVQCNDCIDQYLVPFEALTRLSPDPEQCAETKLEAVTELARNLLKKHPLKNWSFRFDHSTRRAGCCHFHDRQISLSFSLARNAPLTDIHNTLLHEIAHALVGKNHNHDAIWKAKVREIGGSDERCHQLQFSPPRYHVSCENHCWTHTAERRNPRLICRTCGGRLIYSPYTATPEENG